MKIVGKKLTWKHSLKISLFISVISLSTIFFYLTIYLPLRKNREVKFVKPLSLNISPETRKSYKYSFISVGGGRFTIDIPEELNIDKKKTDSNKTTDLIMLSLKDDKSNDFLIWIDHPIGKVSLNFDRIATDSSYEKIPTIINNNVYIRRNSYTNNELSLVFLTPIWTDRLGSISVIIGKGKEREALAYTYKILESIKEDVESEKTSNNNKLLSDMDRDGIDEWIEITTPQGSGGFIGFSLYTRKSSGVQKIFSREAIYQGKVRFVDDKLEVSSGYPREGDPNCCPSRILIRYYIYKNGEVLVENEKIVEQTY